MRKKKSLFSSRPLAGGLAGSLAAAGACVLPLSTVNGAVIYSGIRNIDVSGGISINVDDTFITEFYLNTTFTKGVSPGIPGYVPTRTWSISYQQNVRFIGTSAEVVDSLNRLENGSFIGITSPFLKAPVGTASVRIGTLTGAVSGPLPATGLVSGGGGLFGFTFLSLQGRSLYGWARLEAAPSTFNTARLTLKDWAYEDSGSFILAGQTAVPEPGGAALAALAGMAAFGFRQRPRTGTFSGHE